MIVYKIEDRYDQKTGKKTGTHQAYDHVICDFTGEKAEFVEDLGNSYSVDYSSCDPCFGCRDDEYKLSNDFKFNIYSLYGPDFIFNENPYNIGESKIPIIREILETYEKETGEKVEFLDQLFRWCRVRTVRKLLTDGTYTPEQFGLEVYEDEDEED